MSRAFVRDDAPGEPPIVPPRAPLPEGVPNYVTPRGLRLLREEQAALKEERGRLTAARAGADGPEEAERQRRLEVVAGRLSDLARRLATARLVDPEGASPDVVRFGATVTVTAEGGDTRTVQIVGVDEADAAHGRVAFTSPIARALVGKHLGEAATLRTPHGEEALTVASISYDAT